MKGIGHPAGQSTGNETGGPADLILPGSKRPAHAGKGRRTSRHLRGGILQENPAPFRFALTPPRSFSVLEFGKIQMSQSHIKLTCRSSSCGRLPQSPERFSVRFHPFGRRIPDATEAPEEAVFLPYIPLQSDHLPIWQPPSVQGRVP